MSRKLLFSILGSLGIWIGGGGILGASSLEEQLQKQEAANAEKKDKDSDQKEKDGDKKKSSKKKDESQFAALTPGKVNHDVEIMTYGEDSPRSSFKAKSILRNHDDTLELKGMRARTYDWEGGNHMEVRSPLAWYVRDESLLWSWERSRVIRPDMIMEGDEMVFNLDNQTGTLKGNVRVILIDFESNATPKNQTQENQTESSPDQKTPASEANQPSSLNPDDESQ